MATITITPGNSFTATETVTSTKLNDLGSPTAALTAASIGTADIADDAITPALIADDAVTTPAILDANVTFAKLTDVIDSDTMTGASATTLATSESIKAYVDSSSGIIQTALAITTTPVSTTTAIPRDDTTPLITEGVSAGLDVTMTPTSTSSTIRATLTGLLGNSNAGQYMVITIFEGNTCVGVSQIHQPSQGNDPINATFYFNPASTSEQTYSVRMGKGASGSVGFNTSPTFGGLNKVTLFLEEISG
jgi:hypothetical protein